MNGYSTPSNMGLLQLKPKYRFGDMVVIPHQIRGFYNLIVIITNNITVVLPLQTRGFYNMAIVLLATL